MNSLSSWVSANGSLREIETQLHVAVRMKFVTQNETDVAFDWLPKLAFDLRLQELACWVGLFLWFFVYCPLLTVHCPI